MQQFWINLFYIRKNKYALHHKIYIINYILYQSWSIKKNAIVIFVSQFAVEKEMGVKDIESLLKKKGE